jgi:hypothetical protein
MQGAAARDRQEKVTGENAYREKALISALKLPRFCSLKVEADTNRVVAVFAKSRRAL